MKCPACGCALDVVEAEDKPKDKKVPEKSPRKKYETTADEVETDD